MKRKAYYIVGFKNLTCRLIFVHVRPSFLKLLNVLRKLKKCVRECTCLKKSSMEFAKSTISSTSPTHVHELSRPVVPFKNREKQPWRNFTWRNVTFSNVPG